MQAWSRVIAIDRGKVRFLNAIAQTVSAGADQVLDVASNSGLITTHQAVAALFDAEPAGRLMDCVGIVDVRSHTISPWSVIEDLHPLCPTWLLWRYPEVYWIFVVSGPHAIPPEVGPNARRMHFVSFGVNLEAELSTLLLRHARGMRTWFDPWELRRSALEGKRGQDAPAPRLGMVLDEELSFAAFNGYMLYRRGISTTLVPTREEYKALKGGEWHRGRELVVLEDAELNYADLEEGDVPQFVPTEENHRAALEQRRQHLGIAETRKPSAKHVYITSALLSDAPSPVVFKPFGGLLDEAVLRHVGKGDMPVRAEVAGRGHSAPGAYQELAHALLVRARGLMDESPSTVTAIHGALLMLEAEERLLGHRTYTLALECMTLRHGFEATAECSFAGTADELAVSPRLDELRRDVRNLVHHEDPLSSMRALLGQVTKGKARRAKLRKRNMQEVYAMLEALGQIREVYAKHRKVEEEEQTLQQLRWWRLRAFLRRRTTWHLPWQRERARETTWRVGAWWAIEGMARLVVGIPLIYLTLVLNPAVLLAAVTIIVGGFAVAYAHIGGLDGMTCWTAWDWLRHSMVTFVAMQQGVLGEPGKPCCTPVFSADGFGNFWTLTVLEMGLGYTHLAILVAILLQKITRR